MDKKVNVPKENALLKDVMILHLVKGEMNIVPARIIVTQNDLKREKKALVLQLNFSLLLQLMEKNIIYQKQTLVGGMQSRPVKPLEKQWFSRVI